MTNAKIQSPDDHFTQTNTPRPHSCLSPIPKIPWPTHIDRAPHPPRFCKTRTTNSFGILLEIFFPCPHRGPNQAQIENLHKFPIRQHPRPWPPLQFGRFPLGDMGPFGSFAAGPRIFSEGTDFTIRVIPPPQPFSGPNPKKCQIQEMSFPCRPLLRFLFICSFRAFHRVA